VLRCAPYSVREGYFYATLPLGSPAKHFSLIVDTGSTITYVPCHDCEHCGTNHYNQPYNPRCVGLWDGDWVGLN
jgi:hypothetical protein